MLPQPRGILHRIPTKDSSWRTPTAAADVNPRSPPTLIEGSPCGGESDAALVAAAWDIAEINRRYTAYIAHLGTLGKTGDLSPAEHLRAWWNTGNRLWNACLVLDPMLPRALWPKGYLGPKAWKTKQLAMKNARGMAREIVIPMAKG